MNNNSNEYFERMLRLKPLIEADSALLEKMKSGIEIFNYYGQGIEDGLLNLGKGRVHAVLGVGKIYDPLREEEMHLALKLNHRFPYTADQFDVGLRKQLGAYEDAFLRRDNPPYFVGAVVAKFDQGEIAGIITEDISKGKKLRLFEEPGSEYCTIQYLDGKLERRFIDPIMPNLKLMDLGKKYLEDMARIDLF